MSDVISAGLPTLARLLRTWIDQWVPCYPPGIRFRRQRLFFEPPAPSIFVEFGFCKIVKVVECFIVSVNNLLELLTKDRVKQDCQVKKFKRPNLSINIFKKTKPTKRKKAKAMKRTNFVNYCKFYRVCQK